MSALLDAAKQYPLHVLGWKSFQDLCVAIAEECLRRPVQMFLPGNDAGRDGAFIGRWDSADPAAGESTIQCKFTSKRDANLTLSMLTDELEKARKLAERGLAVDYIILTNHSITGASELAIRDAFKAVGVSRCRVFGRDWIVQQIRTSSKLRMLAPRLYGLGDLSDLLDGRAYRQAQMILSAMGDDLQRLVITEAHRRSVRAISAHNLVLLLGAPAAGKSTIGASLAIGAADIWRSSTIRATSPEDIQKHLNPDVPQFFWIDDAWGNTQYQRQTAEAWNQTFPLMQGAIRRGTRFLITSRDYIWRAAQRDLKIQALPLLGKSQVIINVQELEPQEKAQILYNHLKLGDQPTDFKSAVKPYLPELAERKDFLPETARRLGTTFFTTSLLPIRESLINFFERPEEFLLETITNLGPDCRAAIATVFMNGGRIASPVPTKELEAAGEFFGVTTGDVRVQLDALNGSLLILAQSDTGPYWTYKHPTIGDAFAGYVANDPEMVEVYLKGAKAESIAQEVVCAGCTIYGAPVVVPDSLHELLAQRLSKLEGHRLASFLSYRSNRAFSERMLVLRPELLDRLKTFVTPIKDDLDADLLATLHDQGLLPEELRLNFVKELRRIAVEDADASFLDRDYSSLQDVLTADERADLLEEVRENVLERVAYHVDRLRNDWSKDTPPEDYFDDLKRSIGLFAEAVGDPEVRVKALRRAEADIGWAVAYMNDDYQPATSTAAPTAASTPMSTPLSNLFRDVDE